MSGYCSKGTHVPAGDSAGSPASETSRRAELGSGERLRHAGVTEQLLLRTLRRRVRAVDVIIQFGRAALASGGT